MIDATNVMRTGLDKVLYPSFSGERYPGVATRMESALFRPETMPGDAVIYEEYLGPELPEAHAREEVVKDTSLRTGNKTTISQLFWKQDLPVSKEDFEYNKFGFINRSVGDTGRKMNDALNKRAFKIFVGGFDETTTPDAAYLYSDSHTSLNGDTIDNLETGSLTLANLITLIRKLGAQKDQRGDYGGHMASALLVPDDLAHTAIELTASTLKPGSMDNDLNYISDQFPNLKVFNTVWVGSTHASGYTYEATNYFLVSQDHHIYRWQGKGLSTDVTPWQYDPQKADRYIYKIRCEEAYSAGTWEGTNASRGA